MSFLVADSKSQMFIDQIDLENVEAAQKILKFNDSNL